MFCSKLRYYKTENWSLVTWHWQSAFYNDKPLAKQQNRSQHTSQSSCYHFIHRAVLTNILIGTWWTDFLSLLCNLLEKKSENSEINLQYFISTSYFYSWVSYLFIPLQLEFYTLKLKHWIVWLVLLITWTILGNFSWWGGERWYIEENAFGSENLKVALGIITRWGNCYENYKHGIFLVSL